MNLAEQVAEITGRKFPNSDELSTNERQRQVMLEADKLFDELVDMGLMERPAYRLAAIDATEEYATPE